MKGNSSLFAAICIILISQLAWAKQIRIGGNPQLQLEKSGPNLKLTGSYTLSNSGDEEAKDVFPKILIDQFSVQGEAVSLRPGGQHTWKFSEEIRKSQLKSPLKGQFLAIFENNYSDLNSYPFAIPQLGLLIVDTEEKMISRQVTMALKIKSISKDLFQADYEVHNQMDETLPLKFKAILPQEVEAPASMADLDLKEKASLFGSFQFKNLKGLEGSRYYAYFAVQWVQDGERKVSWVFAPFFIGAPVEKDIPVNAGFRLASKLSKTQLFWLYWSIVALFGFLFLWVYWVMPLRKLK